MPEKAPPGTVWGSVVSGSNSGRKGKIGISVEVTEKTETNVKFHVEVWFWTIYSCSDGSNTLKYSAGDSVTSASDVVVSNKSISHKNDDGTGWSTDNQTKLYSYTSDLGYDRFHTNRTIKFYASFSGIAMLNGTMYANNSVTIVKKASYKVTYNANGGSNAPSSQTKWYGEELKLSSTKPTRTGYIFKGWATSSTATSAKYPVGGSYTYTANESVTLYAVWEAITYTIKFNANGGSNAPSSQTKTYGKTLVLTTNKPTRTNYNFEGWGLSSNTSTVTYNAGGNYTKNASDTLYAVWTLAYTKPRITNFSVRRVNQNGQNDDQGKLCKIIFNWATDKANPTITVSYRQTTSSGWNNINLTASGTSGSVSQNLSPAFSIDNSYEIKVTVADDAGSSYATRTLPSAKFLIDFRAGGDGIAIGKAAENAGFDVYMDTKFEKSVTTRGDFHVTGATTLDGNLTGKYITGTWLQTTAATDLNSTPPKVAVLDNSGWIYSRTPKELKSDMGLSNIFISQTISPKGWDIKANSSRGGQIKGTIKGYEGYTPITTKCYCINNLYIGIINFWLSGSYSSDKNGYTWNIDARNFSSSDVTANFTIKILWIKSNLFG